MYCPPAAQRRDVGQVVEADDVELVPGGEAGLAGACAAMAASGVSVPAGLDISRGRDGGKGCRRAVDGEGEEVEEGGVSVVHVREEQWLEVVGKGGRRKERGNSRAVVAGEEGVVAEAEGFRRSCMGMVGVSWVILRFQGGRIGVCKREW